MSYVELHCHSAYSFLDGASLPEELAASALELGYRSLALTDHDGVYGSMEFAHAARAIGLRPIHGAEVSLAESPAGPSRGAGGRHLTLLVASERGWRNLCRLLTLAHAHTRERPREPTPPAVSLEAVCAHAEGLFCLTGCAQRGVHDEAGVRALREAFSPERLRVELQRPFLAGDRARNGALCALAARLGLRCVASGNVHAHAAVRAPLQDAFVAARHHLTLESSEPQRRPNGSHVLASPAAMAARFADHPQAVVESAALAEQLDFDLTGDLGYRYPGDEDETAQRRLHELCGAYLRERYSGLALREAAARLEQELDVIATLSLAGFFLLHHEILELSREVAAEVRGPDSARALLPPGRGRGSSVSSIVCYLTGLSHIDPLAGGLAMGRFLNPELTSLPDIDIDFPRDIREVLIRRVHERYGHDRAALVATFPSFRARGAIRELGKALGLPPSEIERVARGADGFGHAIDRDLSSALGTRAHGSRWDWLRRLAQEALGLPRHISQHPGGMIISTRPLIDCAPVLPAAMEGRQLVQWDKDSCADAGFLKIDLLGLGMLSAVERSVELIARTRGKRIDLSRIPFDDPATFAAIQRAETTGVFQVESRAQMQSLRRTRPENLAELAIQVAIIRPGPIQGGAVNPYIERRQRLREDPGYEPPSLHPSLAGVLRETLGTIIFQDQVLEVAQAFAGFGPGEADGLRRAMSRKRASVAIERYRRRFIEGAAAHVGAPEALAQTVWEMVAGFAGFGFPKAHSAAFGLLAYQSTWLRVHYGPEFLCALLNEQPMGFYPPDSLAHEAQRRGIELRAVDVNASLAECSVEAHGAVRIGLGYVRGVAAEEVAALVAARDEGGPFASVAELAARVPAARSSLEQLAWSGACDALAACPPHVTGGRRGGERRRALWDLGVAIPGHRVPGGTQLALALDSGAPPALRELGRWEKLLADYATQTVTLGDHALAILRPRLAGATTSVELEHLRHGAPVVVAGLVVARQRPETASGVVFMLIEDEHGVINLIVPPALYERRRHIVRAEPLILVHGRLERPPAGGGTINVLVREIRTLDQELADAAPVSRLREEEETAADFRAVAPPVQSFASGRRR
ncbi:MAG TPA: DNA polymerase III subunit alpha [Solirubrobacteraceae bacterium]|nr:DNA polymerase III subunit alpha [Solirubrobacteraceae bacterium]